MRAFVQDSTVAECGISQLPVRSVWTWAGLRPRRDGYASHNAIAYIAFNRRDSLRSQRQGYFVAQSQTPFTRCVRFVCDVAAASRNTRFWAAC